VFHAGKDRGLSQIRGLGLGADPPEKKRNPQSVVDTQLFTLFGAAIAAIRGAAGLDEFTMEQITAPEFARRCRKSR